MRYPAFLRTNLAIRLGLWLIGFVVVVIFAVANLKSGFSLSTFHDPPVALSQGPVDQSLYVTSRSLANLAATPQEQRFASLAVRSADHDLDQSFASAIRDSALGRTPLPPAATAIAKQLVAVRAEIKTEKEQVDALSSRAEPLLTEGSAEQLRIAQAQLALDNDELENLQDEFSRAGGDRQLAIQQAFDQHRAMQGQAGATSQNSATTALESEQNLRTTMGKLRALSSIQDRQKALASAAHKVSEVTTHLQVQRDTLGKEQANLQQEGTKPADQASGKTLKRLQLQSDQQRDSTDLERRIHDLEQLQGAYTDWAALLRTQAHLIRAALTADVLTILMAALGALVISAIVQALLRQGERKYKRRLDHLRVLVTFLVEVVIVLRAAVILFGIPSDISTIIGLTTAGLTIAFRDFLVSWVGWFLLMGKRGIQVGDWVEIDGTEGEVAKITLLHTYVLETGNWATTGHSTGRQAVFLNKFAVEKKFMNFSTPEQWLWEELAIPLPATTIVSQGKLTELSELIQQRTAIDGAAAEVAWAQIAQAHDLSEQATTPPVVLRTTLAGLELRIRYVTRAAARFDTAVAVRQTALSLIGVAKT